MGKSYDWSTSSGVLLTNLKGQRVSLPVGNVPTFTWMAKYGSVTFNQYGQFLPSGGMNEAGLAIEVLWLDDTEYPALNAQKPVNELQWVQYMLDNCSSVDEVVAEASKLCIVPLFAKLHYFVADSAGNAAVIEFINGTPQVHYRESLSCKAITNDTYTSSLEYFKGNSPIKYTGYNASLNRFSRLAAELSTDAVNKQEVTPVDLGFDILSKVWVKNWTKWNIVYNLTERTISFKSNLAMAVKTVTLKSFNLGTDGQVLYSNVNDFYSGSIDAHFEPFSAVINTQVMLAGVEQVGIPIPASFIESIANYNANVENVTSSIDHRADTLGTLVVEIRNLKVNGGTVNIGVFNSESGFKSLKPINGGRVSVHNGVARLVMYNVPRNHEYAVSYYHDENGNGKLDMNRLGIPVEPYGFSGGSRKFTKARFLFNTSRKEIVLSR